VGFLLFKKVIPVRQELERISNRWIPACAAITPELGFREIEGAP